MSPAAPPRLAMLVSRFNPEITQGLRAGATAALAEAGAPARDEDVFDAPGAFELPLLAKALARTGRYDGVVCLGCVIKGDTAHFEYISAAASLGLMTGSLDVMTPLSFGILTTYDDEQAQVRSRPDAENKGREAALACLETARMLATAPFRADPQA